MKAGYDATISPAIDLAVDRIERGDREVVEVVPESWRYVSTAGVPDPEIQPVVARYEAKLDEQLAAGRSAPRRHPGHAAAPYARPRATSAT